MKQTIILTLTILLTTTVIGQNLVPNPSFEDTIGCPTGMDQIDKAPPWHMPTSGTSDYFNECAFPIAGGVPNNFFGYQLPHSGIAYAGLYTYVSAWTGGYREYISAPLLESLQENKQYYFEMYVSRADNMPTAGISMCSTDGMGAYFSKFPTDTTNNFYPNLPYVPQISNPNGNLLTDTSNWIIISGTFIATGGEQYITIGNFKNDSATQNSCPQDSIIVSYYYIDDILLIQDTSLSISVVSLDNNVHLFPNPFKDYSILKFQNPRKENHTLSLYDSRGRLVRTITDITTDKVEIKRKYLTSGLYFYQLRNDKELLITGKLTVE